MSEKLNINLESINDNHNNLNKNHEIDHEVEKKVEKEKHITSKEKEEKLAELRNEISKEAKPLIKSKIDNSVSEKNKTPHGPINKELKSMMLSRTLSRIRKELPRPQRSFSKIVHSKPVDTISTVGEKTIARPLGLLGGGLLSLIGSLITLYMAKHYGFKYNLLLFFLLFIIGYCVTTLIELIILASKKVKS